AGLQAVLDDKGVDAVLALNCPTAVTDSTAAAEAVLRTIQSRQPRPVVLTSWLGERSPAKARARFAGARVPTHETPDEAARAFMHLVDHARSQRLLLQAPARPAGAAPNRAAAQAVIDRALAAGETVLGIVEAGAVLRAYGVPVIETQTAATPRDVGGVVLNVSPDSAQAAAEAMLARVAEAAPAARIEGFMVQAMAVRPHGRELIAGIATDATFGPVVLFGAGGVAVEVLADRAIGLPPLNAPLAHDLIGRTRIARLLAGYRDIPPVNEAALAEALIALSDLAVDRPATAKLESTRRSG